MAGIGEMRVYSLGPSGLRLERREYTTVERTPNEGIPYQVYQVDGVLPSTSQKYTSGNTSDRQFVSRR